MQGNKSDIILPKENDRRKKIVFHVKILLIILLTNCITYLMVSPSKVAELKSTGSKERVGFVKLLLPLTSFITTDEMTETIASIIDEKGNIIFKKAFIKTQTTDNSTIEYSNEKLSEGKRIYEVQIEKSELLKFKKNMAKSFSAIPYSEIEYGRIPPNHRLEFNL